MCIRHIQTIQTQTHGKNICTKGDRYMREKINGRYYDTQTGTKVCQCPDGYIYRKYNANEFFLLNRSNKIIPIEWNKAKELIYKHGTRIFYQSFFEPENDSKRTNIDIPRGTYCKLRELAGEHNMTMKEYIVYGTEILWRNRNRHKR